jgi:hypothetical protein
MDTATTLAPPLTDPHRHGVREVLGAEAWHRLPDAVRERFADADATAHYAGAFEIVRASLLGRVFAWLGTMVGTPVAPRAGESVEAHVHVRPQGDGVAWDREYRWTDGTRHLVRSTKVVDAHGKLVEKLPARLCMPLDTFEDGGVLHFVSRGYFFDLGVKVWLPSLLSPGVTHVEHIDLGHGWFRFTMTVMHPLFGEVFFQTGRFSASEEQP